MTEIYLIRHAQAEGNLYHMLQGHWDGDVTPLGHKQVDALAERFKDVPVDVLYSSDLLRTRITASAITKYHALPLNTDARLREINIGPWETEFFGNVVWNEPESARVFMLDPEHFYHEGAETYHDVSRRALEALEEIASRHKDERIVIVTHGITLRCILAPLMGVSLNDTAALPIFSNTGVAHLYRDGEKYSVDYINDASHLTPELKPASGHVIVRDEPLDPRKERDYYNACYSDAWQFAHGSLTGYHEDTYYLAACRHHDRDARAVLHAYVQEQDAGLLDLDTARGEHAGYGWISLLYLKPELRGMGCGLQLLARAYKLYQLLGRRAIRLQVAEDNTAALHFYESCGFTRLSYENALNGRLWLMEKKL